LTSGSRGHAGKARLRCAFPMLSQGGAGELLQHHAREGQQRAARPVVYHDLLGLTGVVESQPPPSHSPIPRQQSRPRLHARLISAFDHRQPRTHKAAHRASGISRQPPAQVEYDGTEYAALPVAHVFGCCATHFNLQPFVAHPRFRTDRHVRIQVITDRSLLNEVGIPDIRQAVVADIDVGPHVPQVEFMLNVEQHGQIGRP